MPLKRQSKQNKLSSFKFVDIDLNYWFVPFYLFLFGSNRSIFSSNYFTLKKNIDCILPPPSIILFKIRFNWTSISSITWKLSNVWLTKKKFRTHVLRWMFKKYRLKWKLIDLNIIRIILSSSKRLSFCRYSKEILFVKNV